VALKRTVNNRGRVPHATAGVAFDIVTFFPCCNVKRSSPRPSAQRYWIGAHRTGGVATVLAAGGLMLEDFTVYKSGVADSQVRIGLTHTSWTDRRFRRQDACG